ncbi:MAG: tRNA adenosine(34) deaminase TadA, partial [Acidaminococcaceae bacterium]
TDEEFMHLALDEAAKAATLGEIPIGAVLVLEDKVIAKAHNMRETWQDATAHAEVIAIRQACEKLGSWRLTGATLYVTIEPCPMCAGAIVMSRLSRLVYGSPDSKAGAAESLFNIVNNPALNHTVTTFSGVCSAECTQLMQDFFRQRRKPKKCKDEATVK